MKVDTNSAGGKRSFVNRELKADLIVTGGGLSGVCGAITAARQGCKVVLVQDRPVLGGNCSSEVRLWILGATSHMGNNNRWAREGGVVDEILVENTYRNPEGNPVILDMILLDKVVSEPNITLLLNTAVYEVEKKDADTIQSLKAFCSQNQTEYILSAPLYCDASGDGVVGFLAGAAFRMGAESMDEFGEKFAPSKEYGELLGHTLYFYSKDTGRPVNFIPPAFALNDITKIPRFKTFNAHDFGCKLWWIEYGGRLDTVHDTEQIKWELWKVIYGVWNYIKNSGKFPEAANLTLEWVGTIPGKRESRRFEGDYMLVQQDIVGQRTHEDAVAFGGWSIDLHPADGVFSEKPGCNQWHSKGIYQIPYRSLYSKNIKNLFLAGRNISASHVAFGSTRVMATAAYVSQAVGMSAALCKEKNILPAAIIREGHIETLQKRLLKTGQYIPGMILADESDKLSSAVIRASSELELKELPESGFLKTLELSLAQMVPLKAGIIENFVLHVDAEEETNLEFELRVSSKAGNHTPDITIGRKILPVHPGRNCLQLDFDAEMKEAGYAFLTIMKNPKVKLHHSRKRLTGVLSVFNTVNKAVSNYGKQTPPEHIGMDTFEFWCPQRRPEGHNIAFKYPAGINLFGAENIRNGIDRPTWQPNAWVADWNDPHPQLTISWKEPQTINQIDLFFDADYDHPMESVLMHHPETAMPFCVRNYRIKDEKGNVIAEKNDNYQTHNAIKLNQPVVTGKLIIEVEHPSADVPAAVFSVRCY
ncbi:FAD-dependent oxidoreductase [Pseudobacter ginsenosidimutans]|uniref:FAD dependent oxidoreductase n=1 Tax=Pseudobacter ginsenosidimutans TaxID=661488 RepID=A0A4V2F1Q1_9BACT|nr:FAD-dependent oxidoreductase [Pseudobacter ginsenosidimutans]QEC43195.1 FAD-dependent oxidoreductase [Pseudobacter ginsenosidimutans]RZS74556.1 FAD dependent oxidoreductase [Pseudobacter ginsenosidimutans]